MATVVQVDTAIAIDGPAASGKSTIGAQLADRLGYLYFDTGVMYRAVTYVALSNSIPIDDERAVTALAERIQIDILAPDVNDGRQYTVKADGRDITWEIRSPEVDANVSPVSAYAGVRRAMSAQQRRIGLRGRVVMVGRDIGTVVLPEAHVKIYLDATEEERARRRHLERLARGETVPFETVLSDIRRRDQIDSSRSVAPLARAEDAVYLDSTHLSVPEVLDRVQAIAAQATDKPKTFHSTMGVGE
ncbi:MAG: (d)CMP kinase [Chloroflexi bacterium]|nr:(d)CMP kinase [Chloroflexota bacterium]